MGHTELLTVREAAELLRIKTSTLRDWTLKRRLTFVKLGGRVLFRRSDLDTFVLASVVPAAPLHTEVA